MPRTIKLAKGDTIITSGQGNVYPRGMVIGTVDSSQVGDFGLTYTATITPAADFDHLTEVFVVKVPEIGGERAMSMQRIVLVMLLFFIAEGTIFYWLAAG